MSAVKPFGIVVGAEGQQARRARAPRSPCGPWPAERTSGARLAEQAQRHGLEAHAGHLVVADDQCRSGPRAAGASRRACGLGLPGRRRRRPGRSGAGPVRPPGEPGPNGCGRPAGRPPRRGSGPGRRSSARAVASRYRRPRCSVARCVDAGQARHGPNSTTLARGAGRARPCRPRRRPAGSRDCPRGTAGRPSGPKA